MLSCTPPPGSETLPPMSCVVSYLTKDHFVRERSYAPTFGFAIGSTGCAVRLRIFEMRSGSSSATVEVAFSASMATRL